MHDFILKIFSVIKSFWHFVKILCMFCIMLLLTYWIQNLTHANWEWLGFIKPFLDGLLNFTNSIYSISFNIWGAVFELKYLSALLILIAMCYATNLLTALTNIVEGAYKSTHYICKKTNEAFGNKRLQDDVTKQENKKNSYCVVINTQIKPKFNHAEINVNIDEQNRLMLNFLNEKFGKKPENFNGGFRYDFNDFKNIDSVLTVLFKVLNSNAPIGYAICIQILTGNDIEMKELNKLIKLQHFGKITMAADTAYRYRYNELHKFEASQIGVFQNENDTIEVHEFKEFSL